MSNRKVRVFWFRRDLRHKDNCGFYQALTGDLPVLPVFIFDKDILDSLPRLDRRVDFIHQALQKLHDRFLEEGSGLIIKQGRPLEVWKQVLSEYEVASVYFNHDYEPYAVDRDSQLKKLFKSHGIEVCSFKDQVVFERSEVVKDDNNPYTIFTPYSRKWKACFKEQCPRMSFPSERHLNNLFKHQLDRLIPDLNDIGFEKTDLEYSTPKIQKAILKNYSRDRDHPFKEGTTKLGIHLRFGTVSPRFCVSQALQYSEAWLTELIWREFFQMILHHFPHSATHEFHDKYASIPWRHDEQDFQRWCEGETGYPLVDAGMRELNATGYMHNRVRMVTASFLTKHLLIDWRLGERYFATLLLDFELASNVGNWQWAAGSGCDAQPYFRVFNPESQRKKFDKNNEYTKKWVPELGSDQQISPMMEHKWARERALTTFKEALKGA